MEELAVHVDQSRFVVSTRGKRTRYPTENDLRRESNRPIRVAYEPARNYKYLPENKEKLEEYEKKNQ